MRSFILAFFFVLVAATQANALLWKAGISCSNDTIGDPGKVLVGESGHSYIFCPNGTVAVSEDIKFTRQANCQYFANGTAEVMNITYSFSLTHRWNFKGGVACDPSVTGECSAGNFKGGEVMHANQVGTTAGTSLTCTVESN